MSTENPLNIRPPSERADTLIRDAPSNSNQQPSTHSTGAIPKRPNNRIQINPLANRQLSSTSNTYQCLKSILKQNRSRFTLATSDDLQNLTTSDDNERDDDECSCDGCADVTLVERPDSLRIDKSQPLNCHFGYRRENSR